MAAARNRWWTTWWLAIRPKTLPAGAAPVVVGLAAAAADRHFDPVAALATLICVLLLQIGVNLANDYLDWRRGIDTAARLGPVRVTQAGLMAPGAVRGGAALTFALAAGLGLWLAVRSGWPILVTGVLVLTAALAYSGGPYPLASHGLGDAAAFVFFGPVAVAGTYYIQARALTPALFWASVPVGLMVAAILMVNNIRDIDTDRTSGKRTLAVRLGPCRARVFLALTVAGAYGAVGLGVVCRGLAPSSLTVFLSAPLGAAVVCGVFRQRDRGLNPVLAAAAGTALVFGLLLAVGLIVGANDRALPGGAIGLSGPLAGIWS
jgi:1,4-dihydroxy-2-naphthoate octaprenyltransferase